MTCFSLLSRQWRVTKRPDCCFVPLLCVPVSPGACYLWGKWASVQQLGSGKTGPGTASLTYIPSLDSVTHGGVSLCQFWLVLRYLSEMSEEQTLVLYSGHPLGLFPSAPSAPRAVITNGMVTALLSLPSVSLWSSSVSFGLATGPGCFTSQFVSPCLNYLRSSPTTLPGKNMKRCLHWGLQCEYFRPYSNMI